MVALEEQPQSGSGSLMTQAAPALEAMLLPRLPAVLEPLDILPPLGRGRAAPVPGGLDAAVLLGDLVAGGGGEVRWQVSSAEGERVQGLAGGGRTGAGSGNGRKEEEAEGADLQQFKRQKVFFVKLELN